jgi:serine protease DegQ
MESDENIIRQAMDVKATHVLQSSKFITTQGISTPLFTPNGIGGLNSTTMYSQQMRYNQAAIFMSKYTKKYRFGVYTKDLTPEQKKQYERNTGAVVYIPIEGSPFFEANIIPGDLIISVDDKSVLGDEQLGKLFDAIPPSVDKIIVKVIRNKTEKDIEVVLGKP